MRTLLDAGEVRIDGFLCPGHVSTIIGAAAYQPVVADYNIPCVVAGFEPLDVLQGILMLVEQLESGRAEVAIQYRRAVTWRGNDAAERLMASVFEPVDAAWRGLGRIPGSGLRLRAAYRDFDAGRRFELPPMTAPDPPGCRCGEVLRGKIRPPECPLFRRACTPEHPLGPCMVSSEGTCGAYYRYHRDAPG
jgi:hydrogenase expression/formation protein HypD